MKLELSKRPELEWKDVSIQIDKNGNKFMILIYSELSQAQEMMHLLQSVQFSIKVFTNDNNHCEFTLNFDNADGDFFYRFPETMEIYPPSEWLAKHAVGFITCGVWDEDRKTTRHIANMVKIGTIADSYN